MTRVFAALALSLVLAAPAAAQDPPPSPTPTPQIQPATFPTGATVAYISFPAIVAGSQLGKRSGEQLRLLAEERDADLTPKLKEIQSLEQRLNAQAGSLTQATYSNLLQELERRQRQLQFDSETWRLQLDRRSQELQREVEQKVIPIVEAIRAERNLLMVFSASESGLVAVHPGLDISAEVIERLNQSTGTTGTSGTRTLHSDQLPQARELRSRDTQRHGPAFG